MAQDYLLGHDEAELQRLEEQGRQLTPATTAILRLAGVERGMRVLDLGTGAGDVAINAADLVGPTGSVTGIDRSAESLAQAAERARRRGLDNVDFVRDDLTTAYIAGPFDAVVGRLVLLYTPDPAEIVGRYAALLEPGGVYVAMEYEMTAAGFRPATPLSNMAIGWICSAFEQSGHDPLLGVRLPEIFRRAGLANPVTLGVHTYADMTEPMGPRMITEMVRTLLTVLERTGIATASDVGIDSLDDRLAADQRAHHAVFTPPTLVGTWCRIG